MRQKPRTLVLLFATVIAVQLIASLKNTADQGDLDNSYENTRRTTHCNHIPGRTWYGPTAFPLLKFDREPWVWMKVFLSSITSPAEPAQTVEQHVANILKSVENGDRNLGHTVVCFPSSSCSSELFRSLLPQRKIIELPSFAWTDAVQNKPFELRSRSVPRICDDIKGPVLLSIRVIYFDIDEVEKLMHQASCAELLQITITTESVKARADRNHVLQIYELLMSVFFTHHWYPQVANWADCAAKYYECTFWTLWTKRAINRSNYVFPPAGDGTTELELQRLRAYYNNPLKDACRTTQEIGGSRTKTGFMDGTKVVCLDDLPDLITSTNCLVYSFGVSDDWSFEDSMHSVGCTVLSFDPSIGLKPHQRGQNHWFYPWGLPGRKVDTHWTIYPLLEIRSKLGHSNTTINVLKLDVEGAEYDLLQSHDLETALRNVDQILMEVHPYRKTISETVVRNQSMSLQRLEQLGFLMFSARRNPIAQDARVEFHPMKTMVTNLFLYELSFKKCNVP